MTVKLELSEIEAAVLAHLLERELGESQVLLFEKDWRALFLLEARLVRELERSRVDDG